ncbi:3'-5' exonuclease [Phenylobacterium deserti]|uniref:3'-5' exonuclease n=2 Tax=Phenylobacterium deserti TaxID=1914756 RepID=A0A328AEP2_9CAUL|nr:3'-5' exonuclease [Phenylobacterium deserti]
MAAALEASGRYRVLRKLEDWSPVAPPSGAPTRLGLFVDVETTGLDPARCEILELAMAPFTYGLDGTIYSVGAPFHGLREPSAPIPPEVTALTGLTDEMVAGRRIDPAEVAAFAAPAALVVAHNAGFDRRFLERFCETFTTKPWACSMSQVDWAAEGFEGTKLAYLAGGAGFFYEKHRATHDCLAAIALLGRPLPRSGAPALARLLEAARAPVYRIWAEGAPFDLKDQLKARGYRWNGESNGLPRAWWRDVAEAERADELAWLQAEIYRGEVDLLVRRIDAHDRFSDRC